MSSIVNLHARPEILYLSVDACAFGATAPWENPTGKDEELNSRDILTAQYLATRWHISPRTLERWRAGGTGPAWTQIGGQVRYRLTDILDFEAANRHGPKR